MRTLLIDNKDSFTHNIRHLMMTNMRCDVIVVRNDLKELQVLSEASFDNVVISPGPGHPAIERDFGISRHIIMHWKIPLLGICLGHQGIAEVFGGVVKRASAPMHGRVVKVRHSGDEFFRGVPPHFSVVRYHSLIVAPELPDVLEAIAWSEGSEIMALRHKERPMWGVQFHPESICSEYGAELVRNFQDLTSNWRALGAERQLRLSRCLLNV